MQQEGQEQELEFAINNPGHRKKWYYHEKWVYTAEKVGAGFLYERGAKSKDLRNSYRFPFGILVYIQNNISRKK